MKLDHASVRIIADSRGEPTLEAYLTAGDYHAYASVPSGKSKGKFEAKSVDPYLAVDIFNHISQDILNSSFDSPLDFEQRLLQYDNTPDKSFLGANLILVLSIAYIKLFARYDDYEPYEVLSTMSGLSPTQFPLLFFNLIEGGVHANNSLPFQEYLVVPKYHHPKECLIKIQQILSALHQNLSARFGNVELGDEGGFSIPAKDPGFGLEALKHAIHQTNSDAYLSLDAAASFFYRDGSYHVGDRVLTSDDLSKYYQHLVERYQLLSIEDPFCEDDPQAFCSIKKTLGDKVWIVGDDITVTNPAKLKVAHESNLVNAVIIKPNQIGSITETIEAVKLAKSYGWKVIVSHRSGETEDDFIADLAYGLGADGLKSGAPTQSQRIAKYHRMVEIYDKAVLQIRFRDISGS